MRLRPEQVREIELLRQIFPNLGNLSDFAREAVNERIDRLWKLADSKKAALASLHDESAPQ